jgi:hypothetical protein
MTVNTYAINGIALDPQPTDGSWVSQQPEDRDGNGRPIYASVAEYELMWALAPTSLFQALLAHSVSTSTTGSVTATLPQYNEDDYVFTTYSGCFVERPEFDKYFENYMTNVRVRIGHINPFERSATIA